MKEVIIATKNRGKAKEFATMFEPKGIQVKTLLDYPEIGEIEETGSTFEENAVLKAESVAKQLGKMVIADDSGLMVDALDGRPGIYSARYAGEEKNDNANIDKVLKELEGVNDDERTARFYCALAVASPNQPTFTFSGTCEGLILKERRGANGFGYDPVFYVFEKGRSMAELLPEEKNQISHRANALRKLKEHLDNLLGREERP
ncbi:nucleoside-triphosphatase [Bacillus methanolicus PB1]|uniref:dITP/XTP pyrophosphatase n=1 Tax=Bacillus methanolicus PB1 TaxID=997296 RepID=I3DXW2_BACMT|nr:XTP/dITP diphosphatase [Bacillus methanolicus]EIJ79083.1 nucleoside-triphosphatase [Bacillus methanolicus PB1]